MSFCTVINCMDGRVQTPVATYLRRRFAVEHVDTITEAGPNGILAAGTDAATMKSIFKRLAISVDKHQSRGVAVVGHHDCAGNPTPQETQFEHLRAAVAAIQPHVGELEVIALWVGPDWQVEEVATS